MENALLIGLSRQIVLKRSMEVLSNNLANMNTPGYKSGQLLFEEYLAPVASMNEATSSDDARLSYVFDTSIYRNFEAGAFEQTGNEYDVAIAGDAWMVVQTPDGERYTRNGQLKLNAQGELVTPSGHQVMGEGGPILFGPQENGVVIASDGTISTNVGQKDKLRLVRFENNNMLKKVGETLFSSDEAAQPAEDARVKQGMIEKSNVQPINELTRVIETLRAYQSVAQTLEQTTRLRQDAISQLGREPTP